jgi:transcriptional regulator with XRE-family HTH domain
MNANEQLRLVSRRELHGRTLAALRGRQKLTQVQLGVRMRMSQSVLDRLESGTTSLTFEMFLNYTEAIQTSGRFVVCLLEELVHALSEDGYEVVASPQRRSKEDAKPADAALGGSILAAYVTTWLERNRDHPGFYVSGSVDGLQATDSPVDASHQVPGQPAEGAPVDYVPVSAAVAVEPT